MAPAVALVLIGTVLHIGLILFVLRIFVMGKDLPSDEGTERPDAGPGGGGGGPDPIDLRPFSPVPGGERARLPERADAPKDDRDRERVPALV
jgi:hypothetical protein